MKRYSVKGVHNQCFMGFTQRTIYSKLTRWFDINNLKNAKRDVICVYAWPTSRFVIPQLPPQYVIYAQPLSKNMRKFVNFRLAKSLQSGEKYL